MIAFTLLLMLSLAIQPTYKVLTPPTHTEYKNENVQLEWEITESSYYIPVSEWETNLTHEGRPSKSHVKARRKTTLSSKSRTLPHSLDEPLDLGTFTVTAYCACSKCCGKWSQYKLTASGTTPKRNHTIAVDPNVIKLGTQVIINGNTYTAEDTGSAVHGKHIDIYFDNHNDAVAYGVQEQEVFKTDY